MGALEVEPRIAEAIRSSFPEIEEDQIQKVASEIYGSWSVADGLQKLERADRTSEKDKDSIMRAVGQLRRAAEALREVGFHGGKQLVQTAEEMKRLQERRLYGVGPLEASSIIATHLDGIAQELKGAADRTPNDAMSINSAFGVGPDHERHTSKPKETAAREVARECAKVFELLASRPTVRTDSVTGVAYGPFLEFVARIFKSLDIEASPEVWSKWACRQGR